MGKRRRNAGGVTDGWLPVGRPIVRRGGGRRGGKLPELPPIILINDHQAHGRPIVRRGGGQAAGIAPNHQAHWIASYDWDNIHLSWLGYHTPGLTKQNEDTYYIHIICTDTVSMWTESEDRAILIAPLHRTEWYQALPAPWGYLKRRKILSNGKL